MRLSLRQLLLIVAVTPTATLALLLGLYFTNVQLNDLTRSYQTIGENLVAQMTQLLEYPLYTGDEQLIQQLTESLMDDEQLGAVRVYDRAGEVVVSRGNTRLLEKGSSLAFSRDVLASNPQLSGFEALLSTTNVDGEIEEPPRPLLGRIEMALSEEQIIQRRYSVMSRGVLITFAALLLTTLFAWWVSGLITRPLSAVIQAARRFREGDLRTRVRVRSIGELGDLQQAFNEMAESVQGAQDRLQEEIDHATRELQQTLEAVEIKNVELDLARKRAVAASHVKSEFLANMSHEIRTPMNAIVGFTQLLEKTPLDADQQDYIKTIKQSAATLLKLLEDVLNLSRIEAGKLHLEEHEFDPVHLAEETLNLVAAQAYQKQLELVCKPDTGLRDRFLGDSGKLQQILLNLLHNAVKFTDQGSVSLTIATGTREANRQWLKFIISDTGRGMTPEQQARLFQPFTQLESSTTKSQGGAGLGLVICRKLADALGGDIELESRAGVGSSFTLSLPFRLAKGGEDAGAPQETEHLRGLNVAYYERHPATSTALRLRLQSWGIRVWQTGRLDKLIQELQQRSDDFDLVILGLDHAETRYGDNLHRLWQGLPAPPNCLSLINSVDKSVQRRFERMLGGSCLPKHVDGLTLADSITALTRRGRTRRQAPQPQSLAGMQVLVVEDNRINQKLIKHLLGSLDVVTELAADGAGALEKTLSWHPDVILLDLHLPDMSGTEFLARLTGLRDSQDNIPRIIALTASSDPELARAAREAGAETVLVKPVDEQKLADALAGLPLEPGTRRAAPGRTDPENKPRAGIGLDPELAALLREDLPSLLQAAEQALEAKDGAALKEAVHKINGSAAFCKLKALQTAADMLERAVDKEDWTAILSTWQDFESQTREVIQYVNDAYAGRQ